MRKNDWLLLLVLAILGLNNYFLADSSDSATGKLYLIIKQNKQISEPIELTQTQELPVPTEHGTITLQLEKDGVRVLSAPCQDKICVHQGKITKAGQTLVCMPEKTLFLLTGTDVAGGDLDAVLR